MGLGPLEGGAVEVEPLGHVAVREGILQALPEAQLATGDLLAAPPALRPPARSRLDPVGHVATPSFALQKRMPSVTGK
jgi:hypothetical protein